MQNVYQASFGAANTPPKLAALICCELFASSPKGPASPISRYHLEWMRPRFGGATADIAAVAAEKAGDAGKARAHNVAAVALTENADPVRPQIAQARAFVEKSAR